MLIVPVAVVISGGHLADLARRVAEAHSHGLARLIAPCLGDRRATSSGWRDAGPSSSLPQLIEKPLPKRDHLRAARHLGPMDEEVTVLGFPLVIEQPHE